MFCNSEVREFILLYPKQTLNHLIKDEIIDKDLYQQYKNVIDYFNIEVPFYFNSQNFKSSEILKNHFHVSINNIDELIKKRLWYVLFTSSHIQWDIDLINKYKEKLIWDSDIVFKEDYFNPKSSLSLAKNVKWSEGLIREFWDMFCKRDICQNSYINWSEKLLSNIQDSNCWHLLSGNKGISWTIDLISKFESKLHFDVLSKNENVEWSTILIDKYIDKWDWKGLSSNSSLPWSFDLLVRYEEKFIWDLREISYINNDVDKHKSGSISTNSGITWENRHIIAFKNKINFWRLARFGLLQESIVFRYLDEFNISKQIGWNYHKFSDWHDKHEVFKSGWSNLADNPNFEVSFDLLELLSKYDTIDIYFYGDARSGFEKHEEPVKAIYFFSNCKIQEDEVFKILPSNFITYFVTDSSFNLSIWKVIKLYFNNFLYLSNYLKDLEDEFSQSRCSL